MTVADFYWAIVAGSVAQGERADVGANDFNALNKKTE